MNIPGAKIKNTVYAYAIASTLNQMVNYIPLKINFKDIALDNIYNVTLKKGKSDAQKINDNKNWDDNFQNVVKKTIKNSAIRDVEIEQGDWLNVANTVREIKNAIKQETKPIFWNITGGQRPYIFAVLEIIKDRPKDIIAYLEGNTGKILLKHGKNSKIHYKVEELNIEIALQLMGYKSTNNLLINVLDQPVERKKLHDFYSKFYPAYIKEDKLRKCMPDFNSQNSGIPNFNKIIDKDFPIIEGLTKDEIKAQWDKHKKQKVFGYILEEMLLYLLLKSIEENDLGDDIAALYPSTRITANYEPTDVTIDEFDTLLLTKTGQVICFEAKSGSMSGDVAKSTIYSTYAISGVYGTPVLITPQVNTNDTINKNITKAVRAAERANLEVWYLKEIDENLKNRLKK